MADILVTWLCNIWGFFKTSPISFVAFFGVIVAGVGIALVRRTARQQATLQFMYDYNDSQEVSECIRLIRGVNDVPKGSGSEEAIKERAEYLMRRPTSSKEISVPTGYSYLHPKEKERCRILVLFVLNKLEILAIGWQHKIYDKKMVKDFMGRDVGEFYDLSKPIIAYVQKESEKAFVEFEKFAKKIRPRR